MKIMTPQKIVQSASVLLPLLIPAACGVWQPLHSNAATLTSRYPITASWETLNEAALDDIANGVIALNGVDLAPPEKHDAQDSP